MAVARQIGCLTGNTPYELIYNGIPLLDESATPNPSQRHIGFIGRLEPQKDPLLFLDVLEHLPEFSATMVGTGSLQDLVRTETVRRGLHKRVNLIGGLSHSETLNVLSSMSVLVLSSRWEGLPFIALEAMGLGVPVVSVNVNGMSEIITHEVNGILVDQRSSLKLAQGIKKVLEDGSLRTSIIENARATVKTKFSENHMIQSLHRIYQEMS